MTDQCWFCETAQTDDDYLVKIKKGEDKAHVSVPACKACQSVHRRILTSFMAIFFVVAFGGAAATIAYILVTQPDLTGPGVALGGALGFLWAVPALLLAVLRIRMISKGVKPQRMVLQYPELREQLDQGYAVYHEKRR